MGLMMVLLHGTWGHMVTHYEGTPLLVAFLVGLLLSLDPCSLALTTTSIGYLANGGVSGRRAFTRALFYALGRVVAYATLTIILLPLLRAGFNVEAVTEWLARYGVFIFPPLFIVIGVLMLWPTRWTLPRAHLGMASWAKLSSSLWGCLLLGIIFALAFCPAMGALFLGGLLPVAASAPYVWPVVLVFALSSALPTILLAWLLAFSMQRFKVVYERMGLVQKWLNRVVAILFFLSAILYVVLIFAPEGH